MKLNNTKTEDIVESINASGVRATFVDEKYGHHERNVFDIWLAESNQPTPLVIYIHGGGFVGGDKSKYHESEDMIRFLKAGISVATINYRFMNEKPYGIRASLMDSKRCLQFIRFHAKKYNINKRKIACAGGSAGAGTTLWLAFSDDMADLENDDPVLRESTRIKCAGAFSTQSTYDLFRWDEIVGLPKEKSAEQLQLIARVFGLKSMEGVDLMSQTEIRSDLDFLGKMTENDPPFFVFNKQEGGMPTTQGEINHHPLHAKALKEMAEEVGVEAIVYAPEIGIVDKSGKDLVDFFLEKLQI